MQHWTQEDRKRQSQLIQNWEPWKLSTGATTPMDNEIAKMYAYKDGWHSAEVRAIKHQFAQYKRGLEKVKGFIEDIAILREQINLKTE